MDVLLYILGIGWLLGGAVKHSAQERSYNMISRLRELEEAEVKKDLLLYSQDIQAMVGDDMFDMLNNGYITQEQEQELYDMFDKYLVKAFGSNYREKNMFPLSESSGIDFFARYHSVSFPERNRDILLRFLLAEHGKTDWQGACYGMELGAELEYAGQFKLYKEIQRILKEKGTNIVLCLNSKDGKAHSCGEIYVKHMGEHIFGEGKEIMDMHA